MGRQHLYVAAGLSLDRPWPGLTPTAGQARRAHALSLLTELVALAGREDALALVIAGGLFDRRSVGPGTLATAAQALEALGRPVVIVPGQLDWWSEDSPYELADWPSNVQTITPRRDTVQIDERVSVMGVPWSASIAPRVRPHAGNDTVTVIPGPVDTLPPAGGHIVTTGLPVDRSGSELTVVGDLVPELGRQTAPITRLVVDDEGAAQLRDLPLGEPVGGRMTLDLTGIPTTAALRTSTAQAQQRLPRWGVLELTGTVGHGVLLPGMDEDMEVREDIVVRHESLTYAFHEPSPTDRSTAAEFVRALMRGDEPEAQRHQAIALGLLAMATSR